jgi:hypothetical protein
VQNTARPRELAGQCGHRSSRLRRPRPRSELRITPDLNSAADRKVTRHARTVLDRNAAIPDAAAAWPFGPPPDVS